MQLSGRHLPTLHKALGLIPQHWEKKKRDIKKSENRKLLLKYQKG
jgi:hypothetical protein